MKERKYVSKEGWKKKRKEKRRQDSRKKDQWGMNEKKNMSLISRQENRHSSRESEENNLIAYEKISTVE